MMSVLSILLAVVLDIVPFGDAFVRQLQKRDSVLVADQIKYGFALDNVETGTSLGLADFSQICNDTLVLVRNWQIDTVSTRKELKAGVVNIEASVVVAPFEEGQYSLPPIFVLRNVRGVIDTLEFEGAKLDVKTMPVDTATFQIKNLKPQIGYPVTVEEVMEYIKEYSLYVEIGLLVLFLAILIVYYAGRKSEGKSVVAREPAHIIALRDLDRWRSDKYWAPAQQKAFYSGITDALKNYIDARFGIDAPEMTTAELFDQLKACEALTPELFNETKDLFERADFVKFAKYVADDKENAEALPLAVRFVTSTYQSQIEEESKNVL